MKQTLIRILVLLACISASTLATPITNGSEITLDLQARGLIDFVLSTFGLQDVWDLIQHYGTNVTAPLLQLLTQVLFKGTSNRSCPNKKHKLSTNRITFFFEKTLFARRFDIRIYHFQERKMDQSNL